MAAPKRTRIAGGSWEEGAIPSVVAFRLLVPKAAVPSVIGKGGENIKSIRAATQTQIFADDDQAGEATTVTIIGSESGCETAIRAVWALVQSTEAQAARSNPYVALSEDGTAMARQQLQMLVSAFHAGGIIGKGGEDVRALRDRLGANVNVQAGDRARARSAAEREAVDNGERVVSISGPAAAVQRVRRAVWLKVCRMPPAKRRVRGRSCTGAVIGGDVASSAAGASTSTALTLASGIPVIAAPSPPSSSSSSRATAALSSSSLSSATPAPAGAAARPSSSVSSGAVPTEHLVSEPLELPASLTGRLIGRGGATIDAIRRRSGCAVLITRDVIADACGSTRGASGAPAARATDATSTDDSGGATVMHTVTVVGTLARLGVAKDLIGRALAGESIAMLDKFGGGPTISLGTTVPGFVSAGVVQKG